MRTFAVIALLASCGHRDEAPVDEPTTTAKPRLRIDRREQRVDPVHWNHGSIVGMAFCPGDRELLTIEEGGWLRRWNVAERSQISATALTARDAQLLAKKAHLEGTWVTSAPTAVDCSADGTALALGHVHALPPTGSTLGIAFTVDRDGARTQSPLIENIEQARFAPDGSVRLITAENHVLTWRDRNIEQGIAQAEGTAIQRLAEGGAYLEKIERDPAEHDDGLFVREGDKRIRLRPASDVAAVSVAADGAVAIIDTDNMRAWGWQIKDGRGSARHALLHQGDIRFVAVTNAYFVVVAGNGTIWTATRPSIKWQHIDKPCIDDALENDAPVAIAMAHDDKRMAVACEKQGVRLISIPDGTVDRSSGAIGARDVAWSPDGKLAIRGADYSLRVWKDRELEQISGGFGDTVWWQGNRVAADSAAAFQIYDRGSAADEVQLPERFSTSHLIAASARGDVVVFGTNDVSANESELGVVRAGKLTVLKVPQQGYKEGHTIAVAIATDGSRAAMLRGDEGQTVANELDVVDLASGATTAQLLDATTVAISRNEIVIATPDGGLSLPVKPAPPSTDPWNIATRAEGPRLGEHGSPVTVLRYSPDGRTLAAAGTDGRITLWSEGKLLGKLDGHVATIRALAWSPGGLLLASAGDDGTIVWDLHP